MPTARALNCGDSIQTARIGNILKLAGLSPQLQELIS
jgi:hypothetical protein